MYRRASHPQHQPRRPLPPSRAASLTILLLSPIECFISSYLVPSPSLSRRSSLPQHRWRRLLPSSRATSLIILPFSPKECFVSLHLVPSLSLSRRASLSQHRRRDLYRCQERPVSQFLYSHHRMFLLLNSHPLPLFISNSFSSAALAAVTPTVVKRGQSYNSYILTHKMFRLLTSRPLPFFASKSCSGGRPNAAEMSAARSTPGRSSILNRSSNGLGALREVMEW